MPYFPCFMVRCASGDSAGFSMGPCMHSDMLLRASEPFRYMMLFYLSCPVLSCPVLSCPVLSCPVLSCPVLSCPVLSCPILSCPVLSCHVLPCPVLSCHVLSASACLQLYYSILPYSSHHFLCVQHIHLATV
jgi:hypothetical protein